jgi:hypothetical protein
VAPRGNLDPDSDEEISSSPWLYDSMRVRDRVRVKEGGREAVGEGGDGVIKIKNEKLRHINHAILIRTI